MMKIYWGKDCSKGNKNEVVIHACKSPCHQRRIGYKGSLSKDHPSYLWLEDEYDLYLNIIDPPIPLFKIETFKKFLEFSRKHWGLGRSVYIHCNQGESRSPYLGLLFISKLMGSPYLEIASASAGIKQFLRENWDKLE